VVETGHLDAIQADSGTNGGGSNDRIDNEADFNAGQDIADMQSNADSQQRQLAAGSQSAFATANTRFAAIQQPNLIGTGLQIAGAYASAAAQTKTRQSASWREVHLIHVMEVP
jgi:hypothetical protein